MEAAQVIALLAFLILAAFVIVAARRTGWLLARTREAETFRVDIGDLARRIEVSLAAVSDRIDAVRRGAAPAETIGPNLAAALDAVERYTTEARTLHGPREASRARSEMIAEVERAGRALSMVEHGVVVRMRGRRGEAGPEAETAIKRGYLNLLHAREAIARHALDAIELAEEASPVRKFGRRSA
ncbi:MAG: hypothetical protein L0221_13325 [Chloroflexi bacterium]|nr:hypothetical protein [Chloroflexota bacterium]